jgi:hypothetical protein
MTARQVGCCCGHVQLCGQYVAVDRRGPLPRRLLLAEGQPIEDFDFNSEAFRQRLAGGFVSSTSLRFTIGETARLSGLFVWMRFQTGRRRAWVDTYDTSTSWQTIWLPLPAEVDVQADSEWLVEGECDGGRNPSYHVRCRPVDTEAAPEDCLDVCLAYPELYPLSGGYVCPLCWRTSRSDAELEEQWLQCARCKQAAHRRCATSAEWENAGGVRWGHSGWWCAQCIQKDTWP